MKFLRVNDNVLLRVSSIEAIVNDENGSLKVITTSNNVYEVSKDFIEVVLSEDEKMKKIEEFQNKHFNG